MKFSISTIAVSLMLTSLLSANLASANCVDHYRKEALQGKKFFENLGHSGEDIISSKQPFLYMGDKPVIDWVGKPGPTYDGQLDTDTAIGGTAGITFVGAIFGGLNKGFYYFGMAPYATTAIYYVGNSVSSTTENIAKFVHAFEYEALTRLSMQSIIGQGSALQLFTDKLKTDEGINIKQQDVAKLIVKLNASDRCVEKVEDLFSEIAMQMQRDQEELSAQ